jgi:CTP:molybdopterin cytidylyltransferase MocA
MSIDRTTAYILSAGRGRRLGGTCKGRLEINGESLVERQLHVMALAGITHCTVLVSHESSLIKGLVQKATDALRTSGSMMTTECVDVLVPPENDSDGSGIRMSVVAALGHAKAMMWSDQHIASTLISLVDLPILAKEDISGLRLFAATYGASAVVPQSESSQPGHPIWLSRRFVLALPIESELFSLRDHLRNKVGDTTDPVIPMPMRSAGPFVDLDTADDAAWVADTFGLTIQIPRPSL